MHSSANRSAFLGLIFTCSFFSSSALAAPPNFTAIFSPDTIAPGSISTLTYTIDNTSEAAGISDLGFSNDLPAGMTLAEPVNATTDCQNGTFTAEGGQTNVTMSDYRLGAFQSCTLTVDVTASIAGTYTNTTDALTSSAGASSSASDDLTVDASLPEFGLAFSPTTINPGSTSTITYTIDNSAGISKLTSYSFSQTLPDGLSISSIPNININNCEDLIFTADTGSNSISARQNSTFSIIGGVFSFSGLEAGEVCVVSVNHVPHTISY